MRIAKGRLIILPYPRNWYHYQYRSCPVSHSYPQSVPNGLLILNQIKVLHQLLNKKAEALKSTIVCSQRMPKNWKAMIKDDPIAADAIEKRATKHYTFNPKLMNNYGHKRSWPAPPADRSVTAPRPVVNASATAGARKMQGSIQHFFKSRKVWETAQLRGFSGLKFIPTVENGIV